MIRDAGAAIAIHDPAKTFGGTHEALKVAHQLRRPIIRMNIADRTVTISNPGRLATPSSDSVSPVLVSLPPPVNNHFRVVSVAQLVLCRRERTGG